MTALTDHPIITTEPGLDRARRRLLGVGAIGSAVSMAAAAAVAPWEGDGEWIATVAAEPGRAQAGAILYWLGFLLSICTVLSLVAMVRRRSVRLGLAGTVLAVLGAAAQPGLLISDFFQLAMGQTLPLEEALAVEERMEDYVGLAPMYLLGFLGGTLGLFLLALAAWRAGWLHPAVPALYVAAFIAVMLTPTEHLVSIVVWSFMGVFHVLVGLRVLRATDDEWASGIALPRGSR